MSIPEIIQNFYVIEILTTGIFTFLSLKSINLISYLYNTNQTLKHVPVNPAFPVTYFLGLPFLPYQKTSNTPRELQADLLYEGAKKMSNKERNDCPLGLTKVYMIPGLPSLIFSHGDVTAVLFKSNNVIEKNPMLKTVGEGMFGVGLVTMNAGDWRLHRRALVKMMHSDLHVDYGTAVNKHNKKMVGEFREMIQGSNSKSIDLLYHDHEFNLTLNIAAEIIFGQALDNEQQKKEFLKRFNNVITATEARMSHPILLQKHVWRFYNWWQGVDYKKLVKDYGEMVETLMSKRLDILKEREKQRSGSGSGKNKPPTLMADKLIQLYNEKSITYTEMQAHAKVFFLAALDTTSNTVIGAVYSLSHPENRSVQQKLIEEIDNNFPNIEELDNFSGIADNLVDSKMPYLNGVISEALRIYCPASMIGRQLVPGTDLKFGDNKNGHEPCKIKINSNANFRINGLFLLKQIMSHEIASESDKKKFDPERWTNGQLDRKNFSYAPLGRGVRDCIGRPIAYIMMRLTLLHLYKNFRTELVIKSEADKVHCRKMKMKFLYEIDEQPSIRFFER